MPVADALRGSWPGGQANGAPSVVVVVLVGAFVPGIFAPIPAPVGIPVAVNEKQLLVAVPVDGDGFQQSLIGPAGVFGLGIPPAV